MKRYLQIIFAMSLLLSGCKSNQDAYNATFNKFKELERRNKVTNINAITPMAVPQEITSQDSANAHVSENFTILVGQEKIFQHTISLPRVS